jgi:endonuclease III
MKLAGVGNKTANVFMIEYKQENLMAVDTHVFRVSHRLGLSDAKNVEKTDKKARCGPQTVFTVRGSTCGALLHPFF